MGKGGAAHSLQIGSKNCARGESNPHGFPHRILNPARLPVPPLARALDQGHSLCSANCYGRGPAGQRGYRNVASYSLAGKLFMSRNLSTRGVTQPLQGDPCLQLILGVWMVSLGGAKV